MYRALPLAIAVSVLAGAGRTQEGLAIARKPSSTYECTSRAMCAAFSPDGQHLAIGGLDGTVEVRATAGGGTEHSSRASDGACTSVAFSPDGGLLAAAIGQDLLIYETHGWREVARHRLHARRSVDALVFARDRHTVVIGYPDAALVAVDLRSGSELGRRKRGRHRLRQLLAGPGGQTVVVLDWGMNVTVCSVPSLEPVRADRSREPLGGQAAVSDDGFSLAMGGWASEQTVVRRPATSEPPLTVSGYPLVFSRDARMLATGAGPDPRSLLPGSQWGPAAAEYVRDLPVRLWDSRTGDLLGTLPGNGVRSAMFAPNGRSLLTWGVSSVVRLWDVPQPDSRTASATRTAPR